MPKKNHTYPLIAIIGKPNVGKSALFNRLIRKRKAIVAEEPSVTRDINYEFLSCEGITCRIADSAGYVRDQNDISRITRSLNRQLIEDAGLILFTCEVQSLDSQDFELSDIIRKSGKPCILIVNKVDNEKLEEDVVDFFELGFDTPLPVSAAHGRNIAQLKRKLAECMRDLQDVDGIVPGSSGKTMRESELSPGGESSSINVSIVGKPNVGKSSLLNLLVQKDRAIVMPEPGTTRDTVDETSLYNGQALRFVDTAGLRKRRKIRESVEFYSLVRTERAIAQSTVSILVLDATEGVSTQDKKIAWIIAGEKKGMIIAANKWDLLEDRQADEKMFRDDIYYAFPHAQFADIVPLSARTGYNKITLLKKIIKVYNNYHSTLQTAELNSFIGHLPRGRGDIKYGYQRGTAPPKFEFFIRNIDPRDVNFKRYLTNSIRKNFDLRGVPIEVSLRKR
ncbi:MAG: ribosome biogenesis GTPase Der [Spirochaetes bacterium]|nr:ribosome biogenesis GTPase Der [Spirochaetota bacterium]